MIRLSILTAVLGWLLVVASCGPSQQLPQTNGQQTQPAASQQPIGTIGSARETQDPEERPSSNAGGGNGDRVLSWMTAFGSNGVIAALTFVLAVISGFQAFYVRQANAHTRVIERGHLAMTIDSPGFRFQVGQKPSVALRFKNKGRTPTEFVDTTFTLVFHDGGQPLPQKPPYMKQTREIGAYLVADDEMVFVTDFPVEITSEGVENFATGKKIPCVLVLIDYLDQFGTLHRATFGRIYNRNARPGENNLRTINQPGYNGDRVLSEPKRWWQPWKQEPRQQRHP